MCGIIIWIGATAGNTANLGDIIEVAYRNRHRGDDDGCGFLNMDAKVGSLGRLRKTKLSLEELFNSTIDKKRYEESVQTTKDKITTWNTVTDEKKKQALEKHLLGFAQKDYVVSALIFHHRKKTYGDKSKTNTHPIIVKKRGAKKNIYYFHNGSVYVRPLKAAMKMFMDTKLKGDTDTEVIGNLIEVFLHEGMDIDLVADTLADYFPGFGVIVRAERKSNGEFQVNIFKDSDRSLYLGTHRNGMFLLSEPVLGMLDYFDEIFHFASGHIQINVNGGHREMISEWAALEDRTENLGILRKMIKAGTELSTVKKCDVCEEIKAESVLRVGETTRDMCVSCIIDWTPDMKTKTSKVKVDILDYLPRDPITEEGVLKMMRGKAPWPSGAILFRSLNECPIPEFLGREMMQE